MAAEPAPTTQSIPVRQFSVMLENRIGALHSMIKLLGDFNIHALGISVQDSFDVTILRLVVSDPEGLETLFMERGISFSVNEILVVELESGPTGLVDCIGALSRAETNIYISYPLFVRNNDNSLFAISIEDPDFAYRLLQPQGFKIVFQNDLSR
jgi:hypothetical protein